MIPIPEFAAAVTSARAIGDVFKGLVSLGVDSRVRDAVIEAQNMALQLQNQMLHIADRFEEQTTEINELREKLKRYECWEADAFSERKTNWDFHPEETYKSLTTISVEALKALALINGGAAVAILAYLGNLASHSTTRRLT